jgi:hypothetical protein
VNKIKQILEEASTDGISIPVIRDPKSGKGSVSLTLLFISSILVILGLVGKWSGLMGTIDISNALQFFYASAGLYFCRNWKGGGTSATLTQDSQPAAQDPEEK